MPLHLKRTFRFSKVPTIDGFFWSLKILTTAGGEATSDYLVHRFNPELAVIACGVVFCVVIYWQLSMPRYLTRPYWSAVAMVSVFGTMCADSVHVALNVPYFASASFYGLVLAAIFISWSRLEHTLSIHSIFTTRRELFYWATITATFAFGTALGDLTAYSLNLGYLTSGIVFTVLFCLPVLGYVVLRLNSIAMFWTAYVLTRPLGASYADYLGKPHVVGGLAWGPGNVALLFACTFLVGVLVLSRIDRRRVPSRPLLAG